MNSPLQTRFPRPDARNGNAAFGALSPQLSSEHTLRLVAQLPAPDGLVERVQAGLKSAPRTVHLLHWPHALRPERGWMHGTFVRGAAAAAIVCVVAGGGWRIYSRVQPATAPAARVVVMPARLGISGGFSSAGAMRTPDTLDGPVLTHPVKPVPQPSEAVVSSEPARSSHPIRVKKGAAPTVVAPQY